MRQRIPRSNTHEHFAYFGRDGPARDAEYTLETAEAHPEPPLTGWKRGRRCVLGAHYVLSRPRHPVANEYKIRMACIRKILVFRRRLSSVNRVLAPLTAQEIHRIQESPGTAELLPGNHL